jgi:glycosyltransferase involved in cell wall biosynthesis
MNGTASARPDLSLVIPVYNEKDNLRPLWDEIRAALVPLGRPYEVLLIDDGSTDGSGEGMDALARAHPEVRPIHFEKNAGQSAGFAAGFRLARGPIVVTLDADLQNDPADIPALVAKLESSGAGAVVGIRAGRRDSLVRKVSSKVGNWVRNTLTKDHVTDTGCSLKVYRKDAVMRLKMYRGMHRFLPTLIRTEGYEVLEMPVRHRERVHGSSKYGIANRALSGLADVLAVRWMRARTIHYTIRGEEGAGRGAAPPQGAEAPTGASQGAPR